MSADKSALTVADFYGPAHIDRRFSVHRENVLSDDKSANVNCEQP